MENEKVVEVRIEKKVTSPPSLDKGKQVVPLLFPQRLKKKNLDEKFIKFLEVFKKIHINIPFAKALEQMPHYSKFLKDIVSNKRRMTNYEIVNLTEECSAILQAKLPVKFKNPDSFTLPCTIGKWGNYRALSDLGASINLMPFFHLQETWLRRGKAHHNHPPTSEPIHGLPYRRD